MKYSKKRKLIPLLGFLLFGLLNIFNLSSGFAMQMQGEGVTFIPDDDNPTQYGVFRPAPNMYTGLSVDALNQGEFRIMNWFGGEEAKETISVPGENLTWVYPWYFDDYMRDSTTDNNYIDPWTDISWLNVTTLNPNNVTLSNYTFNSVFDYHSMKESEVLQVPLNSTVPMQIDVKISNTGPKILKIDTLSPTPDSHFLTALNIVSPLNKRVDFTFDQAYFGGGDIIFNYVPFIAHEKGTYKILLRGSTPTNPGFLNLEFLDFKLTDLKVDKVISAGDGDDYPNQQEQDEDEWDAEWFRIEGEKGDLYSLDIGYDYSLANPTINLYSPGRWGYNLYGNAGAGTFDIHFTRPGYVYVSLIDETTLAQCKAFLYLREIPQIDTSIGDRLNVKVSNEEKLALSFTIEEDSFVRFNFTQYGNGLANISSLGTIRGFIYEDSKKLEGYEIIQPIKTKTIDDMNFYYYYFPKGDYAAIVKNGDISSNSIFQLDSKFIGIYNDTIPINSLNQLNPNPSQFLSFALNQDDYYDELYDATYVYINITQPGQYILNTTIDSSSLIAAPRTPIYVVYHNGSTLLEYDKTIEASAQDNLNFSVFTDEDDGIYIGYSHKWKIMDFNFSQVGLDLDASNLQYHVMIYNNDVFQIMPLIDDNTNQFHNNGTLVFDSNSNAYMNWEKRNLALSGPDLDEIEDELYWMWIHLPNDNYNDPGETIPIIDTIEISNFTLDLSLNLALVGDSGYQYCDFWEPPLSGQPSFTFINETVLTNDTYLFNTEAPYINFFENGLYKLLVIPHGWVDDLPVTVNFAIENYWTYRAESRYDLSGITNITVLNPTPDLYKYQINTYTESGYAQDDGTLYEYGLIASYGRHRRTPARLGNSSYYAVECLVEPYKWTQLVVSAVNLVNYSLYIAQNLPWIDNSGPNNELVKLSNSSVDTTYEFGVFNAKFYLIFEVYNSTNNSITFRLDLNQYDTTELLTHGPLTSYSSSGPNLGVTLMLVIVIPAAVGAVVVVYILKRKGRIFTKTP